MLEQSHEREERASYVQSRKSRTSGKGEASAKIPDVEKDLPRSGHGGP